MLSQAEMLALYGLPDFDEFQRAEYFAFTGPERALAERRKGLAVQLHCMLQIGYFKAKNAFFTLSEKEVPAEDLAFLIERYFPGNHVTLRPVTAYEQSEGATVRNGTLRNPLPCVFGNSEAGLAIFGSR